MYNYLKLNNTIRNIYASFYLLFIVFQINIHKKQSVIFFINAH